ncbi:hypothetical protein JK203_11350 [Gluconobacter cerinus]|uniref:hypothetical protein n=1 Tax=Gluconobacter cerinus TaxID=38307 RepID=UPI001B8B5651|nr:hypothetical protein [Gluconobacter cerinus]MBS1041433.1 hypothetical protein [Gluconobacter cerinus]MBS1048021.1 hypothetical protein [Gluconobacter cerinus]
MARPSLDYDRLAPAVRRLHAGGSSVRVIAEYVGISPRSVTSMIVRLDLPRRRKSTSVRRRVSRAALPVGAGLEIARV